MISADGDAHVFLAVARTNAFKIAQCSSRNDEFVGTFVALDLLTAKRKTVAVNGDERQNAVLYLKLRACVNGTAVVIGNGKNALIYHALYGFLSDRIGAQPIDRRKLRIVVGIHAHEGKLGLSALYDGHTLFVALDGDHAVRHTPYHLAEKLCLQNDGAGFSDLCLDAAVNALFEVIARDSQVVPRLKQETLKRGDGTFARRSSRCHGDGRLKKMLFAGQFHFRFLPI